jgi:hypothetical protein
MGGFLRSGVHQPIGTSRIEDRGERIAAGAFCRSVILSPHLSLQYTSGHQRQRRISLVRRIMPRVLATDGGWDKGYASG